MLDTYLRKRAQKNLAKGPPLQTDVISHDPSGRVDRRFADVPTQPPYVEPHPMGIQPGGPQVGQSQSRQNHPVQSQPVHQSRGFQQTHGKTKPPKKGTSGEQEMGIV